MLSNILIQHCAPCIPACIPACILFDIVNQRDTGIKRSQIKRRPLADTVLATLEPETKEYREKDDNNGLHFRVKPNGSKSWQLRYKKSDGKWSWIGLGGYPKTSGSLARKKADQLRADAANGENPIVAKRTREVEALELPTAPLKHWRGNGTPTSARTG